MVWHHCFCGLEPMLLSVKHFKTCSTGWSQQGAARVQSSSALLHLMWCAVYAVCQGKTAAPDTEPLGTCVCACVGDGLLYITVTHRGGERHRCCSRLTLIWRHCPRLSLSCRQIYMPSCVVQSHQIKPWLLNSGPKPVLVFPSPVTLSLLFPFCDFLSLSHFSKLIFYDTAQRLFVSFSALRVLSDSSEWMEQNFLKYHLLPAEHVSPNCTNRSAWEEMLNICWRKWHICVNFFISSLIRLYYCSIILLFCCFQLNLISFVVASQSLQRVKHTFLYERCFDS